MSTLEVKAIQAPSGYNLAMPAGHILQTVQATTGTAWTSSQISLKSTVDAVTYLIFLVKKGT